MPGCMHGKIYRRVEANGGERRPAPIPPSRWVRLKIASRRCYETAGRDAKDYNGVKQSFHFLIHDPFRPKSSQLILKFAFSPFFTWIVGGLAPRILSTSVVQIFLEKFTSLSGFGRIFFCAFEI